MASDPMTSQYSRLFSDVTQVIRETFSVPPDQAVVRTTVASDIAGWDSMSYALLIMKLEEKFAVELPLDRIYELANVGELIDVVEAVTAH